MCEGRGKVKLALGEIDGIISWHTEDQCIGGLGDGLFGRDDYCLTRPIHWERSGCSGGLEQIWLPGSMLTLVPSLKAALFTLYFGDQSIAGLTDIEDKHMVAKGERGGGINWEFGISGYTLLYIK